MIKSKEIAGPSCLTSAADDEPVFVLRANDELAPQIVRCWAERYLTQKFHDISPRQIDKVKEAYFLAKQMEEWKRAHE
jgi:hypothetical protein